MPPTRLQHSYPVTAPDRPYAWARRLSCSYVIRAAEDRVVAYPDAYRTHRMTRAAMDRAERELAPTARRGDRVVAMVVDGPVLWEWLQLGDQPGEGEVIALKRWRRTDLTDMDANYRIVPRKYLGEPEKSA